MGNHFPHFSQRKASRCQLEYRQWLAFVKHLERTGRRCSTLQRVIVGGAACPPSLAASFRKIGIRAVHGWGMTELSPLGIPHSVARAEGALFSGGPTVFSSIAGTARPCFESVSNRSSGIFLL
ncbi:AMP-binding protein [Paraburkholderia fynbosensis]|uniref:AMP-binding protein n=1 Tax=Paraburkholderia fynbosensis TaxID=1200993 RepID=UPI001FE76CC4|nr:AMP-binding protein [Paraburkholderia fynbosensis]